MPISYPNSLAAEPLFVKNGFSVVVENNNKYARSVDGGEIDRGFVDYVTAKCVVLEIGPFNMT